MERETRERLLLAYVTGELSEPDQLIFQQLSAADPMFRQEAEEMLTAWNGIGAQMLSDGRLQVLDKKFYDMLETFKEKSAGDHFKVRHLSPAIKWWVVGSAACLAAFYIGRNTTVPSEVVRYQTVYVKEAAVDSSPVSLDNKPVVMPKPDKPLQNAGKQNAVTSSQRPQPQNELELAQKLRSVYASERMSAVSELTGKKSLDTSTLAILSVALNEDPNTNIRMMILNLLQPDAGRPAVQEILIMALGRQRDPMLQTSIVDILIAVRSERAIHPMIDIMKNNNTDVIVQERIKDGIANFLN